ncbi:hypothetical protein [Streptomyces sp. NBC_00878]|uniref:Tc toxin subunit A-related protein n=1 Tax=Streptomyces sp. NBC_00878 TaxID=2975854 RepID=UPI00224D7D0B|nr:hypothetical protein [Streptomyces sp. NBC_00878]MCX4903451.1 hypothetical protein [Streptomyces sp. NBC_00878]
MDRAYLVENRYSHLEDLRRVRSLNYEVASATSVFEEQVQAELAEARTAHLREELGRALVGYQRLQALILKTVNPALPVGQSRTPQFRAPHVAGLFDAILTGSLQVLRRTPPPVPSLPPEIVGPVRLDDTVGKELDLALSGGLRQPTEVDLVALHMENAASAVEQEDWQGARDSYTEALKAVPRDENQMRGFLQRDLAILQERNGRRDTALETMQEAVKTFKRAGDSEGQVRTFTALAGVLRRAGQREQAEKTDAEAKKLAAERGIHAVGIDLPARRVGVSATVQGGGADGAVLLALRYATKQSAGRHLVLNTESGLHTVDLDTGGEGGEDSGSGGGGGGGGNGLRRHLEALASTKDLSLLHVQALSPPVLVAYLPHVYFFVLPMSIADTLAEMGDFAAAERQYLTAAAYPFLNVHVELPKVWTRLAELYLAWGDALYRAGGNDLAAAAAARPVYERIVRRDGTLPASDLYRGRLAPMAPRAQAVLAAADPTVLDENPVVIGALLNARARLGQLAAGLNFFGIPPDYLPPFGFTHLQNTARYFAQHAAAIEQSYIQFKSQAENEEFRREQMDQQADLARASVELERRGVDEARAGERVSRAGLNYAETQRANAVQSANDFANIRWDLLQLTQLEAWASAQSVSADDEVRLNIPDSWSAYSTGSKRRSHVIQELSAKRTLITHDLEAARLSREIASSTAYKAVAQQQVLQAQSRVAVAQQRVVVAQLQERHAKENQEFLDQKEFGARLWYELARTMRALSQRYLDMAVEVAVLMERAYEGETGRDLRKIRFDYHIPATLGLLGADTLLRDIDYFTLDHVTTTRTKKAPVKVTLSLADLYPMAFDALHRTGQAFFETTMEQFDRFYPGLYLQKLHNVELALVGVTGVGEVHGTLRNIGVSSFRDQSGSIRQQVYPSDVMPLSRYDIRQDALVFRADPNELRLFENNGVATMWQLDLPPGANDFDLDDILDVQVVLCFDAFHDTDIEDAVRASLPTSGTASRSTSLRLVAPDELFFLRNSGEAELAFVPGDFPRFQKNLVRRSATLRVSGPASLAAGLVLRITPDSTGTELVVTTDADGMVAGSAPGDPLGSLIGHPMLDVWKLRITAADNPGPIGEDGTLDLGALTDVQVFQEYGFDYR